MIQCNQSFMTGKIVFLVTSVSTMDIHRTYNAGTSQIHRIDSIGSRINGKHVHWIDDVNERKAYVCHRFLEYLQLFVDAILNNNKTKYNEHEQYLKHCQRILNELNTLIDIQEIRRIFLHIIDLANKREYTQLVKQQRCIERLISRTILFKIE
jgi:hypothetical protein